MLNGDGWALDTHGHAWRGCLLQLVAYGGGRVDALTVAPQFTTVADGELDTVKLLLDML